MKLHTYIIASLLALTTTATAQERLVTIMPQPLTRSNMPAAVAAPAPAHAPSRILADNEGLLGYTDSENPDSITVSGAYFGSASTYTLGAWLTEDALKAYKGCKVLGIRFAVSQSIGNTTGYLFKVTDGQAEQLVSKTLRHTSEGWNEIRFNSAQEYTITGTEGLAYFFDYTESDAMVTAKEGAICAYGTSASSANAALYYSGTAFQSLSGIGNLCIQLIIDVTALSEKDVQATNLLAGNKYHKAGDVLDVFMQFSNTGRKSISSCRWGWQLDEGAATYIDCAKTMAEGGTNSLSTSITLPADMTVGHHALHFFVDQIDGAAPEKADTITDRFIVYENALKRQEVYVEQYTSADSYYVPTVDEQVDPLDGTDGVCLVNVHQSGTPLAVSDAAYLDNLYAYTWPCFTVNRFYFFGEAQIAFDVNDYIFIMPSLMGDAIKEIAGEGKGLPAFASIELQPTYDTATRQLSITATGDVSADAEAIFGDLALTVLLAENGVKSPQLTVNAATGETSTIKNYVHNEVLRGYMTTPTGDRLTVANGRYTATCSTTLPETWKPENMKAVALITKAADSVTDSNVLDMDITQTASLRLNTLAGISTATVTETATPAEYYTLDGTRVNASSLRSGVYIVRQNGQAKKVLVR